MDTPGSDPGWRCAVHNEVKENNPRKSSEMKSSVFV